MGLVKGVAPGIDLMESPDALVDPAYLVIVRFRSSSLQCCPGMVGYLVVLLLNIESSKCFRAGRKESLRPINPFATWRSTFDAMVRFLGSWEYIALLSFCTASARSTHTDPRTAKAVPIAGAHWPCGTMVSKESSNLAC